MFIKGQPTAIQPGDIIVYDPKIESIGVARMDDRDINFWFLAWTREDPRDQWQFYRFQTQGDFKRFVALWVAPHVGLGFEPVEYASVNNWWVCQIVSSPS